MKTGALLSRVTASLGGAVDAALVGAVRFRINRQEHHKGVADRARELEAALEFYRRPELLTGDNFFQPPPPLEMAERHVERLPGSAVDSLPGEIVDLTYSSLYEPRWEATRANYLVHTANRTAQARMFRHAAPHPAIVCLHGYSGGRLFLEERAFVARWLYRIGLDVVLFVLPFHGTRAAFGGRGSPIWPGGNVARNIEGFGQAMHDLRALCGWLRRRGAPSVSFCGMSLGAYTTALLATLEPIDFAGLMIPLASLGDFFWHHGERGAEQTAAERQGITKARMEAALEAVSPLRRHPRIGPERVLVIDAAGDRIVPTRHADWLASHFQATRVTFAGGHVLQLDRSRGFRALARHLSELGLLPQRKEPADHPPAS